MTQLEREILAAAVEWWSTSELVLLADGIGLSVDPFRKVDVLRTKLRGLLEEYAFIAIAARVKRDIHRVARGECPGEMRADTSVSRPGSARRDRRSVLASLSPQRRGRFARGRR